VGDGVAKLKMRPPEGRRPTRASAFAAEGMTVPRLTLGNAGAEIAISKGIGSIKRFDATSKDGWLKLEGRIEFKDPFALSTLPGCMTFRLSDELRQREPNFSNIEFMLPPRAKQQDGSFAIPTKGKLTALGWDVRSQCGKAPVETDEPVASRPALGAGVPGVDHDVGGDLDRSGRRVMPPVDGVPAVAVGGLHASPPGTPGAAGANLGLLPASPGSIPTDGGPPPPPGAPPPGGMTMPPPEDWNRGGNSAGPVEPPVPPPPPPDPAPAPEGQDQGAEAQQPAPPVE
jgi:hypothetical protein